MGRRHKKYVIQKATKSRPRVSSSSSSSSEEENPHKLSTNAQSHSWTQRDSNVRTKRSLTGGGHDSSLNISHSERDGYSSGTITRDEKGVHRIVVGEQEKEPRSRSSHEFQERALVLSEGSGKYSVSSRGLDTLKSNRSVGSDNVFMSIPRNTYRSRSTHGSGPETRSRDIVAHREMKSRRSRSDTESHRARKYRSRDRRDGEQSQIVLVELTRNRNLIAGPVCSFSTETNVLTEKPKVARGVKSKAREPLLESSSESSSSDEQMLRKSGRKTSTQTKYKHRHRSSSASVSSASGHERHRHKLERRHREETVKSWMHSTPISKEKRGQKERHNVRKHKKSKHRSTSKSRSLSNLTEDDVKQKITSHGRSRSAEYIANSISSSRSSDEGKKKKAKNNKHNVTKNISTGASSRIRSRSSSGSSRHRHHHKRNREAGIVKAKSEEEITMREVGVEQHITVHNETGSLPAHYRPEGSRSKARRTHRRHGKHVTSADDLDDRIEPDVDYDGGKKRKHLRKFRIGLEPLEDYGQEKQRNKNESVVSEPPADYDALPTVLSVDIPEPAVDYDRRENAPKHSGEPDADYTDNESSVLFSTPQPEIATQNVSQQDVLYVSNDMLSLGDGALSSARKQGKSQHSSALSTGDNVSVSRRDMPSKSTPATVIVVAAAEGSRVIVQQEDNGTNIRMEKLKDKEVLLHSLGHGAVTRHDHTVVHATHVGGDVTTSIRPSTRDIAPRDGHSSRSSHSTVDGMDQRLRGIAISSAEESSIEAIYPADSASTIAMPAHEAVIHMPDNTEQYYYKKSGSKNGKKGSHHNRTADGAKKQERSRCCTIIVILIIVFIVVGGITAALAAIFILAESGDDRIPVADRGASGTN